VPQWLSKKVIGAACEGTCVATGVQLAVFEHVQIASQFVVVSKSESVDHEALRCLILLTVERFQSGKSPYATIVPQQSVLLPGCNAVEADQLKYMLKRFADCSKHHEAGRRGETCYSGELTKVYAENLYKYS